MSLRETKGDYVYNIVTGYKRELMAFLSSDPWQCRPPPATLQNTVYSTSIEQPQRVHGTVL